MFNDFTTEMTAKINEFKASLDMKYKSYERNKSLGNESLGVWSKEVVCYFEISFKIICERYDRSCAWVEQWTSDILSGSRGYPLSRVLSIVDNWENYSQT
jgi:hypothetical protein